MLLAPSGLAADKCAARDAQLLLSAEITFRDFGYGRACRKLRIQVTVLFESYYAPGYTGTLEREICRARLG